MSRILQTSPKHLLEQQQKTNVHWISLNLCKFNELGFTTCSAVAELSFRGNAAVKYGLQQIKQCPIGVLRRLVTSDGRRRDDKFSSVKDRTIKEITAGTIIEKAVCSPLNNQATSETSNGGICWFGIQAYHLQTAKWSVAKSLPWSEKWFGVLWSRIWSQFNYPKSSFQLSIRIIFMFLRLGISFLHVMPLFRPSKSKLKTTWDFNSLTQPSLQLLAQTVVKG